MKLIRVKISSDFILKTGLPKLFDKITYLELVNVFNYTKTEFFVLQKVVLKPGFKGENIEKIIKNDFQVDFFQIVKRIGNEVLCIMRIRHDSGFWPIVRPGPWAIIPPVTLDAQSIHLTMLSPEKLVSALYDTIADYAESFKILSVGELRTGDAEPNLLMPNYTNRQREIAQYAVRNGYFSSPKKITAKEIAKHFSISVSAVNEHLRKVTRIALEYFFV